MQVAVGTVKGAICALDTATADLKQLHGHTGKVQTLAWAAVSCIKASTSSLTPSHIAHSPGNDSLRQGQQPTASATAAGSPQQLSEAAHHLHEASQQVADMAAGDSLSATVQPNGTTDHTHEQAMGEEVSMVVSGGADCRFRICQIRCVADLDAFFVHPWSIAVSSAPALQCAVLVSKAIVAVVPKLCRGSLTLLLRGFKVYRFPPIMPTDIVHPITSRADHLLFVLYRIPHAMQAHS